MAVTMTIVSLALPQAAAFADVVEKKRTKTARKVVVMTPEERAAWTQGLPFVQERIPYTDVLKLKSEDRLKYIIKHPKTLPKARLDVILLVLDDDRVVRTVLPVAERDEKFWDAWDKLRVDSTIMDAYSPPLSKPKPQRSVLEYLVLLRSFPCESNPRLLKSTRCQVDSMATFTVASSGLLTYTLQNKVGAIVLAFFCSFTIWVYTFFSA